MPTPSRARSYGMTRPSEQNLPRGARSGRHWEIFSQPWQENSVLGLGEILRPRKIFPRVELRFASRVGRRHVRRAEPAECGFPTLPEDGNLFTDWE